MHTKGLVTTVAVASLLVQVFAVEPAANGVREASNSLDTVAELEQSLTPMDHHQHEEDQDDDKEKEKDKKKQNSNTDEDYDEDEDAIDKYDIADQVEEAAEKGKKAAAKFEEAADKKAKAEKMDASGKLKAAAFVPSEDDEDEDDEEEIEEEDFDADAYHSSGSASASASASASLLSSSGVPSLSFSSAAGVATGGAATGGAATGKAAQPSVKAKHAKSNGNVVPISIGATLGAVLIAAYTIF